MATVWIPALMRDLTGGAQSVVVPGATVRQVVDHLAARYPGIEARLLENGKLRRSINVAVDGVVSPLRLRQEVGAQSEVHFLPAIGGGATPRRGAGGLPPRSSAAPAPEHPAA